MPCEPAYRFPAFATGWHFAVAEQEINRAFAEESVCDRVALRREEGSKPDN
jgi:hypothetical protein